MRICFAIAFTALAALAADTATDPNAVPQASAAAKSAASSASSPVKAATVKNPTSVVRANPDGRLIRAVVAPGASPIKPVRGGVAITTDGEFDLMVEEISKQVGVDPLLVHAVIRVESNYNQFALSDKGAQGYMQLIPKTAQEMGVEYSFSRRQNLEGGIKYLKSMLDQFPDLRLALAAYNAGPEAVQKYSGIPPYKETQDYINQVSQHYNRMSRERRAALASLHPEPAATASTAEAGAGASAEPEHKPVTAYTDTEGRIHMSTAD